MARRQGRSSDATSTGRHFEVTAAWKFPEAVTWKPSLRTVRHYREKRKPVWEPYLPVVHLVALSRGHVRALLDMQHAGIVGLAHRSFPRSSGGRYEKPSRIHSSPRLQTSLMNLLTIPSPKGSIGTVRVVLGLFEMLFGLALAGPIIVRFVCLCCSVLYAVMPTTNRDIFTGLHVLPNQNRRYQFGRHNKTGQDLDRNRSGK